MGDTKWADVAHYYKYIEHEVLISHSRNRDPLKRISKEGEDLSVYYRRPDLVEAGFITVPTLRHRDDMTEAEDNECMLVHTRWISNEEFKNVIWSLTKQHKTFDQHSTHWLISRGFDVFGLIESGQAIRKEVGNGL